MTRPILRTERIRLEPLTAEHTEDLIALDSDPDVLRFVFGRALTREEVLEQWMPWRLSNGVDRGLGYWVGHAGSRFVGWWCLAYDAACPHTAELGYRLARTAWGQGYATEGARAMLEHAFHTVGLPNVWAETMAVNTGSRRVLTKLGMRHVRTDHRAWEYPVDGVEHGEVVYELDRDAFG